MQQYQITHTPDVRGRKWHALVRDDGSVSFFYTKERTAGQFVVYDSIDNQNAGDLRAENERLRRELDIATDAYSRSTDILSKALRGPETSPEYDMDYPHPAWAHRAAAAIERLRNQYNSEFPIRISRREAMELPLETRRKIVARMTNAFVDALKKDTLGA
jgi:hypothetical protein